MPRTVTISTILSLSLMTFIAPAVLAQPADLLDRAIEENKAAPPAAKTDVDELLDHADRLADRKEFDEAIALYSKAYRLAPNHQSAYVRLLVTKRAAGRMTADDRQALDLIREQESGRIEQTFRSVRLDILQAGQALRSGDTPLARAKANHARTLLEALPRHVDAGNYQKRVQTLLRKIDRAAARRKPPAKRTRSKTARQPDTLQLTDRGVAAAGITDDGIYPTGEIFDLDAIYDDQAQHVYDRDLAAAMNQNRVDWLLRNNEAALAMPGMTFPPDWPERVGRRARHRDGVVYEGQPFVGEDGQTYFAAIYDLGDLVHPIPNFYASYPGTAREQRNQDLDRAYLRFGSHIFNGYADDLAAGLPLLHFFGGIDNYAITTRTDPYEVDRIKAILGRFINGQSPPPGGN
ncbi:MAG: hypothetical protein ACE5F9_01280 [Phycisphaerae bacterium]